MLHSMENWLLTNEANRVHIPATWINFLSTLLARKILRLACCHVSKPNIIVVFTFNRVVNSLLILVRAEQLKNVTEMRKYSISRFLIDHVIAPSFFSALSQTPLSPFIFPRQLFPHHFRLNASWDREPRGFYQFRQKSSAYRPTVSPWNLSEFARSFEWYGSTFTVNEN